MTQYDNTNRFSLFKNDRKQEDRDADFTGTLNIEGVEYFVDAWKPRQPGGKLVLSGRVKPKAKQPNDFGTAQRQARYGKGEEEVPRRPNGRPAPSYADLDDDLPF
jgi:hypothetical protein